MPANADHFMTPMTWGVGKPYPGFGLPGDSRISGFGSPKDHWRSMVVLGDPPVLNDPLAPGYPTAAKDPTIIEGVDPKKMAELIFYQKDWRVTASYNGEIVTKIGPVSPPDDTITLTASGATSGKFSRFSSQITGGGQVVSRLASITSTNKQPQEIFTLLNNFDYNDTEGANSNNMSPFSVPYYVGLRRNTTSSHTVNDSLSCYDTAGVESGKAIYNHISTAIDDRYGTELTSFADIRIGIERIYFRPDGSCAVKISFYSALNGQQYTPASLAASGLIYYFGFAPFNPPFSYSMTSYTGTANILGVPNIPMFMSTNVSSWADAISSVSFTMSYDITPFALWTY